MNLDDYVIDVDRRGWFVYVYLPTNELLLTTQHVSVTTLLYIATSHDRKKEWK